MIVLGLSGLAGSGKDTVAGFLRVYGFLSMALADPMKEFCRSIFDFSHEQLYGPSQFRNAPDPRYLRPDGTYLSPREALQTLGTDWGRERYPLTWVNATLLRIERLRKERPNARVCITDVRFANEIDALRTGGVRLVRIVRPGAGLAGAAGLHASETEQAAIPDSEFDYILRNDGSLEDLRLSTYQMLQVL